MVDFVVRNEPAMARAAARTWFWHMFRTYRARTFALSVLFFSLMMALGIFYFKTPLLIWASAAFLLLNAMYVPIFFFGFQRGAAKMAKNSPEVRFTVTASEVTRTTAHESITFPLAGLEAYLERAGFGVLVFSRYVFWCLPHSQTPVEALAIIRRAVPNNSFKPKPLRGSA